MLGLAPIHHYGMRAPVPAANILETHRHTQRLQRTIGLHH
jgi:hypothetical protein